MQVNKNNVTQFLTATNMCFMIPVYQRNYDWGEDNCKQLWNDIWNLVQGNGSQTHFLGTICSKTINGHEKTIIDGQQRITTITLLMKAIHDYVDNAEFKADLDSSYLRNNGYGVAPTHKVKLHLNKRDDTIYSKLLQTKFFCETDVFTKHEVSSRIYQNYAFFYECIKGLDERRISEVRSALDRLIIVDLDVEAENPQEIFESLNSTGLDLTDVDLLRNYLLMSLDHDTQVRLYDEYWYKIEENVNPSNMVRFFIDYFIFTKKSDALMHRGRRAHINEKNLYVAYKDYFKTLAKGSGPTERGMLTEELLRDMYERSCVYKKLVFEDTVDMNSLTGTAQTIYSIVNLNQAIASRPVLLYVMSQHHEGKITEAEAQEMLDACLSLVFRAKVSGATGINGQFAGNVLLKLPDDDMSGILDTFWKVLTSGSGKFGFPSDREFYDALAGRQIFEVLRARGVKYLFYVLEQHTKAAKGLPRFDDPNITVEHIMPKTLTEQWQAVLGDDLSQASLFLNRLGNLALTSNNPEMQNKLVPQKADWYKESSFPHTRALADKETWGLREMQERGNRIADECVSIWALPAQYQPQRAEMVDGDQKRRPPFRFSMIGLEKGDEVYFANNPSKTAVVTDDNHVVYECEKYTLSALARILLGRDSSNGVQGPSYFMYDGETLSELRDEVEGNVF